MKIRLVALLALLSTINPQLSTCHASPLGTAFTYQGRLNDGGSPAQGIYDLRFTIYDAASGPAQVGNSLTNLAVAITNGYFLAPLDFGPGVFTGDARWLEIGVRTNGGSAFTTLSPRQPLTPAPHALYAPAAGVAATASSAAAGSISNAAIAVGAVNSSGIADGTIAAADVNAASFNTTFWQMAGNTGTTPGTHFMGTTDNQPMEVKVNGGRALRLEPTGSNSVNVIAGASVNSVASGVIGATISGGGAGYYYGAFQTNRVDANFGTIGGGLLNTIQGSADETTIAGGRANTLEESAVGGTIGGGRGNNIRFNSDWSTIGGGSYNQIQSNSWFATVGGGEQNHAGSYATVPGGNLNSAVGAYSFAAGRRAKANQNGAFVWADWTDADFASTAANQFLVRASGGVGINKNNPATALDVNGTVTATAFVGSGSGLTRISSLDAPDGDPIAVVNIDNAGRVGIYTAPDPAFILNVGGPVHASAFYGNGQNIEGVWALDAQDGSPKGALLVGNNGYVGIGTTNPAMHLHVASASGPASALIGQHNESGGYTALWMGVSAVTNGYAYLQGVRSAGFSYGNLILNLSGGSVGIGRHPTANKLEVEGNASKSTAGDWLANSDARIKRNIQPIAGALDKLARVRLVSFQYTDDYRATHAGVEDRPYLNVVAQEFREVFPDAVKSSGEKLANGSEILQVDSYPLTIYSAAAIQELDRKLAETRAENAKLKARIERLEQLFNAKVSGDAK